MAWGLRFLSRMAACILSGAVLTVVVAWSCALWGPQSTKHAYAPGRAWPRRVPSEWERESSSQDTFSTVGWVEEVDMGTGSDTDPVTGAPTFVRRTLAVVRSGWPFPAL